MKTIVLSSQFSQIKLGIFTGNHLEYFYTHPKKGAELSVGDIYCGQVAKIAPNIEAAFIDVGLKKTAFLHKSDIFVPIEKQNLPIEQLLQKGQKILVQIEKIPMKTKGARVSTSFSLANNFLVYLPFMQENKISKKVPEGQGREELHKKLEQLSITGLIARTSALDVCVEKLEDQAKELVATWKIIEQKAIEAHVGEVVFKELDETLKIVRDFAKYSIGTIYTDCREEKKRLEIFCQHNEQLDSVQIIFQKHVGRLFNFNRQYMQILKPRVSLSCGGSIIIEQTESMTTIDVNTGSFHGHGSCRQTLLKTNLDAAEKIMEEIKLRQIGGIIIIDFIDMNYEEDKDAVKNLLEKKALEDIMPVIIYPWTHLGLIEISRKRQGPSLLESLSSPCPLCLQLGRISKPLPLAQKILEDIIYAIDFYRGKLIQISAHSSVLELLENHHLEEKLNKEYDIKIQLMSTDCSDPTHYEIIALH
jgi:ribonuclease G